MLKPCSSLPVKEEMEVSQGQVEKIPGMEIGGNACAHLS